ncbi:MAG TPA: glycosyltransferase family 4 protein [Candidatus Dormibacteraeota bacterium]|nr:glycosyltransferase family 4 protein [Candidatus Dormibacteraeota bacterium]
MVAYFFPPLGGVGVQRTLKFVRNLREAGWRSVVLTAADPPYPVRDPGALAEVPGDTEVVRTRCPEPAGLVARLAPRHTSARATTSRPAVARIGPLRAALRAGASWWIRLARAILFPDEQVLWHPFATRAARAVMQRRRIDAIYSTSPPVTGHLIARSIRGSSGRPWVADFRDPWVGNAFADRPSRLRDRLQRWLERRIVHDADRVVLATPSMARDFERRYPDLLGRFVCIENGYDRSELTDLPAVPRDPGRFTIVYSGSIYGERELVLFLDGLELLASRRPDLRDRLLVEFVGRVNVTNQRAASAYLVPERLGTIVSFTGFLPRREALARMRSGDALLQLIADDPGKERVVGGKLTEYLAFDLPILAVVPRGDARSILEDLDWGVVVDPEPEAIAGGLERILTERPRRGPADPERRYDRVTQARRLAALLDELTESELDELAESDPGR